MLADNRLALSAGWDDELLASELAALEGDGFDLGLIGFSDQELAALLAEPDEATSEPGEEGVPRSRPPRQ